MSLLVCFSGKIGSGKSSVSEAVAKELGWSRTGFGDYLRAELARSGSDPTSREALQDLGQRRVDADPEAFCRDVLSAGGFRPGDNFVIDGVRHIRIFRVLCRLSAPSTAKLLFLQAADSTRSARVGLRPDRIDLERASIHLVEAELVDAIPAQANLIVNSDLPLDEVVTRCIEAVQSWS